MCPARLQTAAAPTALPAPALGLLSLRNGRSTPGRRPAMEPQSPEAPARVIDVPTRSRRAVVVGGGITGLATALVLAGRGYAVSILERDEEPEAASADEAFARWGRRGVAQVRHSHAFLGRLRNLLRDRHPALLADLLAAGARELRMLDVPPRTLRGLRPAPGDDDLVMLGCRRITFEWVLRRHVLALPGVEMHSGTIVDGLLAEPGDPPRVVGVSGERRGAPWQIRGDLVVDASGRQSAAARWLGAIGARAPREDVEPSGLLYYSRFYRLRDGETEPEPGVHPAAADYNWVKYAIFPTDGGTFSITLASPQCFPEMKVLANPAAFDEVGRSLPAVAAWIGRADPIGDPGRPVQAMGGLVNRLRRFVDERGPVATGFFALGDAAYCTNPLYGRGCAQGFLHAEILGEALGRHPGDPAAVALEVDAAARREIEPFFRASVVADRDASRKAEGRSPAGWRARLVQRFFEEGVIVAMRCDPVVFRAFVRMMNMMETPEQAFGRPEVVLRALWVWLRGERRNPALAIPPPPDRAALLERCRRAAAA